MTSILQRSVNEALVALICWDGDVGLYAETLSFLAWKLRNEGARVIRFGCAGVLDACTSINSANAGQNRSNICERCQIAQQGVSCDIVFEVERKDGFTTDAATLFLANVRTHLESGEISDVLDMEYADLPLCRIAFFDFAIVTKLAENSRLDAQKTDRFVSGVSDLIKLLSAFERFSQAYKITHVVYVNGNYSQNTLARYFFEKKGVIDLSLEPQLTSQAVLNRVMLVPGRLNLNPEGLFPSAVDRLTFDAKGVVDMQKVMTNFGARIKGADFNAYTSLDSQGVAIGELERLERFLRTHEKIHSFFLSSEDELTPHSVSHGISKVPEPNPLGPYRTQIEFTLYFLREAAKHPKVGFLIRLHPRMAVNKRDHFESEEHIRYKNLLSTLEIPENVLVLYGDSKVSSYFVISQSNLVVISWSTIGLEALLLGVPVISAFPDYLMYPITKFCNQPACQTDMETALFEGSNVGDSMDKNLLIWMSYAFEGQFFATAAPRGQGGVLGKLYRVTYRLSKRIGAYELLAWIINFLYLHNVTFCSERLLIQQRDCLNGTDDHIEEAIKVLHGYRIEYHQLLNEYGYRNGLCS